MIPLFFVFIFSVFFILPVAHADTTLSERLRGRILLQVEQNGEAWYVDPITKTRFFLCRPRDAFSVMRNRGLGITDVDLSKIPVDGSPLQGETNLVNRLLGRILLQVEQNGEAWYVDPILKTRAFLGRPHDAFAIMRARGLGITDTNLATIPIDFASLPADACAPTESLPTTEKKTSENSPPNEVRPEEANKNTINAQVKALSDLFNNDRTNNGVHALILDQKLMNAATTQAREMCTLGYFSAVNPDGKAFEEFITEAGYAHQNTGILIAKGSSDAQKIFNLWNYEEAKNIIRLESFEDIGVGYIPANECNGAAAWVVYFASSQTRVYDALADIDDIRQQILQKTNEFRLACDPQECPTPLQALTYNTLLEIAAQGMAEDMLARNFFDHVDPDGKEPSDRVSAAGYLWSRVAENLAKGQTTVDEVMTGWMNSPGHRANILRDGITELGVGLTIGENEGGFSVYWVQNFGAPR